jgi:RNA polymerase sigma-70 factor (ECF subfamily)
MKINYKDADGKTIELEVSEEVGTFYLESVAAEKSNDRRNSRPDRHTQLSTFTYEDVRFFSDGTDLLADLMSSEAVSHAMSQLTERQQYLIQKCCIEGWSYTDLYLFLSISGHVVTAYSGSLSTKIKSEA